MNIVWFKRDLRLEDNPVFKEAALSGPLIALYIVEPELWQQPDSSNRQWSFIFDSLMDLKASLELLGGTLIIRVGDVISVLKSLRETHGEFTLWSHEETGNRWTYTRDILVGQWCSMNGIPWIEYPSHGVIRKLKSRDQWSFIRNQRMSESLIPVPKEISFVSHVASDSLPSKENSIFLNPLSGNHQQGGRTQGQLVLNSFLGYRGKKYKLTLSKPGVSARHCSRLSAHIAYGTLSVREIEQATLAKMNELREIKDQEALYFHSNLKAFLSRLAWRCHFVQKLEQQPNIETHCMHGAFEGMREPYFNEAYFEAWKKGETGYPLVDACMRSLIQNGWLTFRMRAMLVSFASYNLWLDWRQTAPYMARLFTDYEPGIHYSQFQMQSGVTGINAIRIYNPIKQSTDHDPEGKFILRYIPELTALPTAYLHEPWRYPSLNDYNKPIVDFKSTLQFAREQLFSRRADPEFKKNAKSVHQKLGSRAKQIQKKKVNPQSTQLSFDF